MNKKDLIFSIYLSIYSLVFLAIRFSASWHAISFDEAEQFFDTLNFELGYKDQPPLFSWLVKALNLFFDTSAQSMALLTHILIIVFLVSFYFALKEIWSSSDSQIITVSLVFFFIYSLDFNRYLIHSILMTCIASLSFWCFLRIIKYAKRIDYFLFGILIALGLLAKYNFVLFILVLFATALSSKISRQRLISINILLSFLAFALIFTPHFSWLLETDFLPFKYAAYRAGFGELDKSWWSIVFEYFWQIILYFAVVYFFFSQGFSFKKQNQLKELCKSMLLWIVIIPASVIIFFKTGAFFQRWLCGISFLIVFAVFSFIDISKTSKKQTLKFTSFSLVVIVILYLVQANTFFNFIASPNLLYIHIPYKNVFSKLKDKVEKEFPDQDLEIYAFKEKSIYAGLRTFLENQDELIYYDKNTKILSNEKTKLIVFRTKRFKKEQVIKSLAKKNYKYQDLTAVQAPYLHKADAVYELNIGLLKDSF